MKRTKLYELHRQLHGRLVDFAGWELPVDYGSIIKEHTAVRTAAGIFDVSHMGQLFFRGPDVRAALNWLICNLVPKPESRRAVYAGLLNEAGCFIDDVIAGMLSETLGFMVVNAANVEKAFDWVSSQLAARRVEMNWELTVSNESSAYNLLAVQGKTAFAVLEKVIPGFVPQKPFSILELQYEGVPLVITFTGYTGEPGVELLVGDVIVEKLFRALVDAGVQPCGLGARDSLRLEKGYSLYGHEITEQTNAWEAGLGWTVKLKKADFIGKQQLEVLHAAEAKRHLVGLALGGRFPVRRGARIFADESGTLELGSVTSGSWSPTLKKPIALAYLAVSHKEPQTQVMVRWRDQMVPATVTTRTFVA